MKTRVLLLYLGFNLILLSFVCFSQGWRNGHYFHQGLNRWRGNHYLNLDGMLPWGLCHDGQGFTVSQFSHPGLYPTDPSLPFVVVVLGASFHGESLPSGQPTNVSTFSTLIYLQHAGVCPADYHCNGKMWPWATAISSTRFSLQFSIRMKEWSAPIVARMQKVVTAGLYLEFDLLGLQPPISSSLLPDRFSAKLLIEGIKVITMPLCYHHVTHSFNLGVCTAHLWGRDWLEASSFNPSTLNVHGQANTMLRDFFLFYGLLQGAEIHMNESEFYLLEKIQLLTECLKYTGSFSLDYKGGWNGELSAHGFEAYDEMVAHEHIVVASCIWQARLSSLWLVLINPDNFITLVDNPKQLLGDFFLEIYRNHPELASMEIPMVRAFPETGVPISDQMNVLSQNCFLHPDLLEGNTRHILAVNPRHSVATDVHWLDYGHRNSMKYQETFDTFRIHAPHLMTATRPQQQPTSPITLNEGLKYWAAELDQLLESLKSRKVCSSFP